MKLFIHKETEKDSEGIKIYKIYGYIEGMSEKQYEKIEKYLNQVTEINEENLICDGIKKTFETKYEYLIKECEKDMKIYFKQLKKLSL